MESCLYAGLTYADFNMEDLDEKSRKIVESVGEFLVKQKAGSAIPRDLRVVAEILEGQKNPWFDFGIEFQLGHAGTHRVMESFPRFGRPFRCTERQLAS